MSVKGSKLQVRVHTVQGHYDANRTRGRSLTAPMTREGSPRPAMQPGVPQASLL
jgi:hypothetical protein